MCLCGSKKPDSMSDAHFPELSGCCSKGIEMARKAKKQSILDTLSKADIPDEQMIAYVTSW